MFQTFVPAAARRMPPARRVASILAFVPFVCLLQMGPAAAEDRREVRLGQPNLIDAPWTPWFWCWEKLVARATSVPADQGVPDELRVCVLPTDNRLDAKMITFAGGRVAIEQTFLADGTEQPAEEPGCRGWRRAEWSQDGERLFTTAELACQGEPVRRVSGVTLITSGPIWIDVQGVDTAGREEVRVRRYRRTAVVAEIAEAISPELSAWSASAAQPAGSIPLSVEDVLEASRRIGPNTLEAALLETRARFTLDSRALITIADAGVPPRVIDLMVALSFPEHFDIARPTARAASSGGGQVLGLFDPMWTSPGTWMAYSDPYFWPYYYAPFGYSYWWGGYDPYYYRAGPISGVGGRPRDDTGDVQGRAVEGRGYTRVRSADAPIVVGRAKRRGETASDASGNGSSSGSSRGGSSGGASPQGYSSGGSRSGSGSPRTAQPR